MLSTADSKLLVYLLLLIAHSEITKCDVYCILLLFVMSLCAISNRYANCKLVMCPFRRRKKKNPVYGPDRPKNVLFLFFFFTKDMYFFLKVSCKNMCEHLRTIG